MIQRIQSLLLMAVPMLLGIMQFMPLWSKVDPITLHRYTLYAWKLQVADPSQNLVTTSGMPYLSLGVLALVISILAIYTIWRYDNRSLQMQLSSISMLLATVLMGMMVYFCTKSPRMQLSAMTGTYQLGFYMPALVVLCNLLAKHFIQKDEKFIQSTNRLR